jgi:uncharacterized membrane protein YfcA
VRVQARTIPGCSWDSMNLESTMLSAVATVLLLAPIAFLGSFVYGVTGFGTGLFTIPLASHFYEVPFVLAVFALLDSVNAVRLCLSHPLAIVRAEAVRLAPCCVVGVLFGALLILVLPTWGLMLALGIFVLAYAIYSLIVSAVMPTINQQWAYIAGLSGGSPPPCSGREAHPMRSI